MVSRFMLLPLPLSLPRQAQATITSKHFALNGTFYVSSLRFCGLVTDLLFVLLAAAVVVIASWFLVLLLNTPSKQKLSSNCCCPSIEHGLIGQLKVRLAKI